MEAVTTRGSLLLVVVCAFLAVSSTAAATSPIPKAERTVGPGDQDIAFLVNSMGEKHTVDEQCLPRQMFCIGPFEPDFEAPIGKTGVRFVSNNTTATVGHDPARTVTYGPYAVPTLLTDDVRVCWAGCMVTDSVYARGQANVTFYYYAFGDERRHNVQANHSVDSLHPSVIPRKWCAFAQYSYC